MFTERCVIDKLHELKQRVKTNKNSWRKVISQMNEQWKEVLYWPV